MFHGTIYGLVRRVFRLSLLVGFFFVFLGQVGGPSATVLGEPAPVGVPVAAPPRCRFIDASLSSCGSREEFANNYYCRGYTGRKGWCEKDL